MYSIISILLLAISATVLSFPNQNEPQKIEKTTDIQCAEGEIITEGHCIPVVQFYAAPTAAKPVDPEKQAKKQKKKALKKKKLKKQLDKELKEIKRLVLEGLDKGNVNITEVSCPQGQQLDIEGQCVLMTNSTVIDPKKEKMQKKLERELEIVLKKEIQNELKRKERIKKRKQAKAGQEAAAKNGTVSAKERSEPVNVVLTEDLPLCTEPNQQGKEYWLRANGTINSNLD